jgi:hypothetical protein
MQNPTDVQQIEGSLSLMFHDRFDGLARLCVREKRGVVIPILPPKVEKDAFGSRRMTRLL